MPQDGGPIGPWPRQVDCEGAIVPELRKQGAIALPLVAMNLAWFAKISVTTMFLGRLGELQLAGGSLGFCFANVTGLSVLAGLCGAMEPICGQAHGAGNYRLLRKTLVMGTILLLSAAVPISFLWLNIDKLLVLVGQKREIAAVARVYVAYLLPDLVVTAFLAPLKAYLSAQGVTLPILFSSVAALALHVPINVVLFKAWGLRGVSAAVWLTDLSTAFMLGSYVVVAERKRKKTEEAREWLQLLRLSGPCCLTTCLEWWCYEILILLTGKLPHSQRMISVLAVVFNFDYLLYAVMVSLATCASARVSNELGAGNSAASRMSARVCLGVSLVVGCLAGAAMAGSRGWWASLFSRDDGVVEGVRKMMLLMALVDVVNFPLAVCGGIVRGTARPWLGVYANLCGFYLVALPLAAVLAFRVRLGVGGLLLGTLVGVCTTTALLLVLVLRTDWAEEGRKAQELVGGAGGAIGDGHIVFAEETKVEQA
ncbi:unnamed protein product [Spirodela intermedia]|uniref:Protein DETOXIFICATION n=1 Tax=Spirodela intermedia TaxID=51605 RepID=A0A7I8IEP3_SPIIN|nr:unnamed protein product [Spirodela intermedia]CAA6656267.1 unnamed protein product [Spirodela intermedia]